MKRFYWLLIAVIVCLVGGVLIWRGLRKEEPHPHIHGVDCHCQCFQQKEEPHPHIHGVDCHCRCFQQKEEPHPHIHGVDCHCQCFQQKEAPHRHDEGVHHEHEEESVVQISSRAREMIGLKTDKVALRHIRKSLRVTGEIAQDSEKLSHVISNIPGEIIEVKYRLGNYVEKGTLLALVKSSRDGKIEEIKAPASGLIIGQHISEEKKVDQLTTIFTIADLSVMKASFDVHPKDIALVQVGQKVKVKTFAHPGKRYSGKITHISPRVDERTRTIKIRVDIDNYDRTLKFGMFVTGYIEYTYPLKVASIPNSAIQTRDDERIVFIPLRDDKFIAREIETGIEGEDFSQILSGLKIGEMVVTEGGFHLKAELRKALIDVPCHSGHH